MGDYYPSEVTALQAYYQNQIGMDYRAAFSAAWETWEDLQAGKEISVAALAAIPDPVGGGLCSSLEIVDIQPESLAFE